MVTIVDVARVAGVSKSTVSRVLDERLPRAQNATAERVRKVAAELGYDVTMVRDATADYSDEHMRAALDINIPSYASAIVTASEVVRRIGSVHAL